MMFHKVSAVITTHNRKKLLKKAIDSVLGQTYQNIDCIVVDDASEDGTEEALEDYIRENKIIYHYIPKKESKGGNYARNLGINNSKGDYIAFLDDDDEWLPEKIEKQVKAFEDDDVGFVYCGIITENNYDKKTRHPQDIKSEKYKDGDISREVLIHIIAVTTTIMVRRTVLDKAGFFDENLKYWQEYEFSIRLLQLCKAKCIRENLVLYRVVDNDKNRISNKIAGWEEAVRYITEKHKHLISTLNDEEENLRQMYICIDGFGRAKKVGSLKYMVKFAWRLLSDSNMRRIVIGKYLRRSR